MTKPFLLAMSAYFALLGAIIFFLPRAFYEFTPGVLETGPFNSHVFSDIGLAFMVSAAALSLGAIREDRMLALFGAGFPVLHGIFHLSHWATHGMHLGLVEAFEIVTTTLPAGLAFCCVLQLGKEAHA